MAFEPQKYPNTMDLAGGFNSHIPAPPIPTPGLEPQTDKEIEVTGDLASERTTWVILINV